MRNISTLLLLSLILYGCANSGNSKDNIGKDSGVEALTVKDEVKQASDQYPQEQTPDFLALSKMVSEAYKGNIAGVEVTDSSGPFVIKEFYSDTLSFRIIFCPKTGNKDSVEFSSITKAAENNYQDFLCFSFVYPMKDPEKMKDYHADNVTYPADVKAYVGMDKHWKFLSQSKVRNIEELGRFQVKSIYSVVH